MYQAEKILSVKKNLLEITCVKLYAFLSNFFQVTYKNLVLSTSVDNVN